jgi:aminoglycoside 3-N-acetyltransferase
MEAPFSSHLIDAYQAVGIHSADIVYLYSDFRGLGRYAAEFSSRNAFCEAVVQPLLANGATVLVTTFTYTTSGRFDVESTPTKLGAINKWFLSAPGAIRSEHPVFSYAALGPKAKELTFGIGKSAFGYDSVFDRLYGRKAAFLYVGRPVSMGNTIIHHIEQACGATYRTNKAFATEVFRDGSFVANDYSAFLRRRDVPGKTFAFRFETAAQHMFEAGLVRQVGDPADLTNISAHGFDAAASFLKRLFYEDPGIFIEEKYIDV